MLEKPLLQITLVISNSYGLCWGNTPESCGLPERGKRFFRLCQKYDCEICIRGLPFNPNDPASILQLDQLAAFAEFESRTASLSLCRLLAPSASGKAITRLC